MAGGLTSIGIKKIVPAQIDWSKIPSGSVNNNIRILGLADDNTSSYFTVFRSIKTPNGIVTSNGDGNFNVENVTIKNNVKDDGNYRYRTGVEMTLTSSLWFDESKSSLLGSGSVVLDPPRVFITSNELNNGSYNEPRLLFRRNKSPTGESPIQELSLGSIIWFTDDRSPVADVAKFHAAIEAQAHADWKNTPSNSYPTNLYFYTTPSGSGTSDIRMTVAHDGNVGIGTITPDEKLDVAGRIAISAESSSPTVAAGVGVIYTKTDGKLYFKSGDVAETDLTSGGASGDITGVTAGNGLTGGGDSGGVTLTVGAGTGIDVSSTQVSVDVSDFMSNGSNNRVLTAAGTDSMNAEANLTFDGTDLTITAPGKVVFDSTDTYIAANSDNPEDLEIHADQDLHLKPDNDITIRYGDTQYGTFDGSAFCLRMFRETNSTVFPLQLINKEDTGTSAGIGMQFQLENTSGAEKTAGQIEVVKGAGWDSSDNTDAEMIFSVVVDESLTEVFRINSSQMLSTKGIASNDYLRASTDVYVGANIYHYGDTDTKITFSTDQIDLTAGNIHMIKMDEDTLDTIVINEGGADVNFRVETSGEANAVFVEGGDAKVGLGTSLPKNRLQLSLTCNDGDNGISLVRNDGTTESGDLLGGIGFDSGDGNPPSSILESSAYVAGFASEDHATTDKGGYLSFGVAITDEDDDTTSTEIARITENGFHLLDQNKIIFDSTDTYIAANSDATEDLEIHADDDLKLMPDDDILIYAGVTQYATFDGAQYRLRLFQNHGSAKYPLELINKDNTSAGAIGMKFQLEDDGDNELTAASMRATKTQAWEEDTDTTKDGQLVISTLLNNAATDTALFTAAGSTIYQALSVDGITNLNGGATLASGQTFLSMGNIVLVNQAKIAFDTDSTNTYIAADSAGTENLEIHADNNIELHPDGYVHVNGQLYVNNKIYHNGDTDTFIAFTTNNINIQAGGNDIATFNSAGDVGIGTDSPDCKLHVRDDVAVTNTSTSTFGSPTPVCLIESVSANAKKHVLLDLLINEDTADSSGTAEDFFLRGFDNASAGADSGADEEFNIDGDGNLSNTFTGQHICVYSGSADISNLDDEIISGMIVESVGIIGIERGVTGIDDCVPIIKISSQKNSKKVYGVLSGNKVKKGMAHFRYFSGSFHPSDRRTELFDASGSYNYEKDSHRYSDNSRYFKSKCNSIGEGKIWVTNIYGNIENGDYITTSEVPGYGGLQDDDLLHNYTVAKCTQNIDWDSISETVDYDNQTYKKALIACTYHCG